MATRAEQHKEIRESAIAYAGQGWHVFPVPPGTRKSYMSKKYSGGRRWGASNDVDEVRGFYKQWLKANIGIPTGELNGFFVVETDTVKGHDVDGAASLRELEAAHGPLPDTKQAISPSGSVHRYYKHPGPGVKVWCSASSLGAGIDVKGDGGMVIAPPSMLPATRRYPSMRVYEWLNDGPIADAPAWLVELVTVQPSKTKKKGRAQETAARKAQQRLDLACEELAGTPEGCRNDTLNRLAFALGKLVSDGRLDEATVRERLTAAALQAGSDEAETAATLDSALGAADAGGPLPVIEIVGGGLPYEVDQAERALLASGIELYQRGEVVRPATPRVGA